MAKKKTEKKENETLVKCLVCGKETQTSIQTMLLAGWEKCCNVAMHLEETKADVVAEAVNSIYMARGINGNLTFRL